MKFIIEQGEELLSTHAGLGLVGMVLAKTAVRQKLDVLDSFAIMKKRGVSSADCVSAMVGLMSIGKPDFDAVEEFRGEHFFKMSLGLGKTPSSPTLRQRLGKLAGKTGSLLAEESAKLLRTAGARIGPCHTLRTVDGREEELLALDVDVSPFDNSQTKKEGVSRTYKGCDGYAPIFAYLGAEGWLLGAELREGKQHCQNGTEDFLRTSLKNARLATDKPILVRLDSGNDSAGNIRVCAEQGAHWLIKRNLRNEDPAHWLSLAKQEGELTQPRDGKKVWYGETYVKIPACEQPARIVYEVTQREFDAQRQLLLMPEQSVDVNTWWTSLEEAPEVVAKLYREHGTSEQFHSELKSDMDLERLPSGNFATNTLVLEVGMLTYNILRLIGQEGLSTKEAPIRKNVYRRRIRSVIQDMIYMAVKIVRHAGRIKLKFGKHNRWYNTWRGVFLKFA